MKLTLQEWNQIDAALGLAMTAEELNRARSEAAYHAADSKRAYIARENYQALQEKIRRETLG
jgi:hypothetical protein